MRRRVPLLAVCALAALAGVAPASAQSRLNRPKPEYLQLSPPDQAEGAKVLDEFRQHRLATDYYLDFELRVMPRRGKERRVAGGMWGAPRPEGSVNRIVLYPTTANDGDDKSKAGKEKAGEDGAAAASSGPAHPQWLFTNGPAAEAWAAPVGGSVTRLGPQQLLEPIAGTPLSVFELQMPFVHWREFVYEGITRHRGRPAHRFVVYPPAELAAAQPDLTGVRLYIDGQFLALLQAELLGADALPRKTITVGDLKRFDDQWIPKAVDVRDETTRDKTRFEVTGAALNQHFVAALFEPDSLAELPVRPAGVQRFAN